MPDRGTKPRWRRLGVRAALCLLAGMIVSVAIAEAAALWAGVTDRSMDDFDRAENSAVLRWKSHGAPAWRVPLGAAAEPLRVHLEGLIYPEWMFGYSPSDSSITFESVRTYRGTGVEIEELLVQNPELDELGATVATVSSGWPLACLRGHQWDDRLLSTPPPSVRWSGAIEAPAVLRSAYRYPVAGVLLFAPAWPGLLIDSAFFGGVIWTALFGAGVLVRTLRRRGGRCVACGYNLAGLNAGSPCPECGG